MSNNKYITKDNGTRLTYNTGAMKEQPAGKGRYDLLPPCAIKRLADIYERGANKYGDRNWQKGIPLSRLIDSALRHSFQYLEGMRDEDHAGAAAWNWIAVLYTETMIERGILPTELNDLPNDFQLPQPPKEEEEATLIDPISQTIEFPPTTIQLADRVRNQMGLEGTVVRIDEETALVMLDACHGVPGIFYLHELQKIDK